MVLSDGFVVVWFYLMVFLIGGRQLVLPVAVVQRDERGARPPRSVDVQLREAPAASAET